MEEKNALPAKMEVKALDLFFGEKQVLKKIGLRVPDHSVTALIGPSGCGKSTLLRAMNRMHDLNPKARIEGDILLDGQTILGKKVDATEVRRKVGMVFQKPNPFAKSIFDNIAYGLRINGQKDKSALHDTVVESLHDCSLWDETQSELHKSALELSGGQQQRLCIARTIAVRPEVILMDEPCSALDPISTAKIEELILRLKSNYSIVIVTHNMQQARRVADFTAFLYLGELIEHGPTEALFSNPQHELTAKYLKGSFG